jgi:cation transport ATPase
MKSLPTLQKCLAGKEWYNCPIPVIVFVVFVLLFIYSVFALVALSKIIQKAATEDAQTFENETGHSLKQYTQAYVINIILCFVSLLVISFFIYKSIPENIQAGVFNQAVGIAVLLFVIVITSWNIHVFRLIKSKSEEMQSVVTVSILILILSLIAGGLLGYEIFRGNTTTKIPKK